MKRILFIALLLLLLTGVTEATMTYGASYYKQWAGQYAGTGRDRDPIYLFINEVETSLEGGGGVDSLVFTPGTAPSTASEGEVYYDSASNGLLLYTGSAWVTIDTAGASSLDTAYNTGASITVDGDAVTLTTGTSDNNVVLAIAQNESTNDNDAVTITMGSGATGKGILINSQTGGTDIAGDNWSVAQTGVITSVSTVVGASGLVGTQSDILNNETNNTWTFDSDTSTTEDFSIGLGANTNIITFSSASGAVTLELGALDDVNGVGNIYFDSAASQITLAANQAADDLTIQVTGAQNASLDLRSAGTGTDAIKVYASAGGIDVDGTGSTMVMTNTANGSDDDFTIELAGTQDSSLILQSAGTGGDALSLITSNAAGDIKINSGDMIDIDAADKIDIAIAGAATEDFVVTNTGGSIILSASEDATDAINIDATGGGIDIDATGEAGQDIVVTNTGGSIQIVATEAATDAIVINASTAAGGIDITSQEDIDITTTGASGEDITISNTGGSVNLSASEAATDAISIAASAGGITMTSTAEAASWTQTSTGAADDLTIAVAGNTNSSLILQSAGSGTDALSLATVTNAGDIKINSNDKIDMDSTGTFELNVAADDLTIQIDTSATGGEDLSLIVDGDDDCSIILNSDGTGADAISIIASNAAGGINVDAGTYGIDIDVTGGDIAIDNDGAGKNLDIDISAGSIYLDAGEAAADAIAILATGGGIDLTSTATYDIDITATGGKVIITGNEDAAGAIQLTTAGAGGTSETITVTNDQGTAAGAIALAATAGGITAAVAEEKELKIGNAALDSYFLVHASATAASELVQVVNSAGTDNAAIALTATAGGITAKVADSKQLNLGNALTDTYVRVAPSATAASEVIQVVNSAGTDNAAIALTATAGGITAKVADGKQLNLGNASTDTYVRVAPSATAASEIISVINSAGTDEGAIVLTSTAGGVDINANAAKDINLGAGQVIAVAGHSVADAILLHADAGAAQTIRLVNDEGTSVTEDAGAIQLTATAGGIQIQSDANLDDAVVIRADGGANSEMTIHNDQSTQEDSIEIISDQGGIDITAATGKNMDLTAGQIALVSNEDAASAISLTTNTGTAETIVITNTLGNTADAITVTATAGGINIDSVSDIAVDLSGAGANFDVDSAAGSVYLDGGEAAANAIALQATNAAGGIDVDFGTGNMEITGTGASADFILDCDLFSIDGTGTSNVTVTANAGGEDFTVTQAGAVDASLILSSAGTAADALQVTATTGGITLNTGLATGILINTATYEHKIKYFPISQGVVAASEVIVGGGCGLVCTSLDAGANEAGATEGYAAVGDDEDILIWSFPLPDDFVDTGTQADLIIEFDIDEQAAEECNIDVRIFEYDGTANATAIITDTIVAANDGTRAWKGLVSNSAGIGNETDLDQGDHLIIELTATADADDFRIYGFRLTYRAGLQATQ